MRFCYAGPVWKTAPNPAILEEGYDGAHSCNAIGAEFCRELKRLGLNAEQWNFWYTDEQRVPTHQAYDGVFIYDHSMLPLWQKVVPDWAPSHKTTVIWLHTLGGGSKGTPGDAEYAERYAVDHCSLICLTCEELRNRFLNKHGSKLEDRTMVLPWACSGTWQWPPPQPNPYLAPPPVLLWAARLNDRALNQLHEVAERCDELAVHVLSSTPYENPNFDRSRIPGTYHGCYKHGTFNHFLYHASLALDVAIGCNQVSANSKFFDLLCAGLPVVYEPVPGDWIVRETGFGIEARYNDIDSCVVAIQQALNRPWDRNWCRRYMQTHHTWTNRAHALGQRLRSMQVIRRG